MPELSRKSTIAMLIVRRWTPGVPVLATFRLEFARRCSVQPGRIDPEEKGIVLKLRIDNGAHDLSNSIYGT